MTWNQLFYSSNTTMRLISRRRMSDTQNWNEKWMINQIHSNHQLQRLYEWMNDHFTYFSKIDHWIWILYCNNIQASYISRPPIYSIFNYALKTWDKHLGLQNVIRWEMVTYNGVCMKVSITLYVRFMSSAPWSRLATYRGAVYQCEITQR